MDFSDCVDPRTIAAMQTSYVPGLRYGSTLVPFSDEDKDAMKVSTTKCLKVLGFTKTQNVSLGLSDFHLSSL